jgi:hypothetical protein
MGDDDPTAVRSLGADSVTVCVVVVEMSVVDDEPPPASVVV